MKGQKLWKRAKKIIPGGNQLLSKRSERFLPELWPAYYSKAKGCEIWDLENNHFYDFAQMGVGSCILGYSDDYVDKNVINAINKGSMTSLNSYEEVELAERLTDLHNWADMVRFARTGGEACAIAIRIARAVSGKSKVAFCGYHGWHDWYIAANIKESSNLDDQLLPGLLTKGVPKELINTAIPFNYNNIGELKEIVSKNHGEIGAIIMEPRREHVPEQNFLNEVRKIANEINAVLIFDEVTSGFRINLGGIHLSYGVNPDIAIFGKALGNGYPISAVIGKKEVMDVAQDTFISSTFWTERIGFVAALATIRKMENKNVPYYLTKYGKLINKGWKNIANKNSLNISINGILPLTHINFDNELPLVSQSFYTQEMLYRGYLVGASVYTTYSYTEEIINNFINASDKVFAILKDNLEKKCLEEQLDGGILQKGFKRVT